ncbi:hypothetical protein MSAN_01810600 [Mycena sanguinolenta]|uniref:Uncharacterized protein n=1 Tax=Mycena sanguinolenta TaxID=230812 RepID=A0A8H7CTC5_9AGAR|nr:hypothetical protein MSAN_01810600 [Mycena sanguinolenta]
MRVVLFPAFHNVERSFDTADSEDVSAFTSSAPQLALRFRQEQDDVREGGGHGTSKLLEGLSAISTIHVLSLVAREISPPPRPPHTTSTSTPPLHPLSLILRIQYLRPADLTLASTTNAYPSYTYTLGLPSALPTLMVRRPALGTAQCALDTLRLRLRLRLRLLLPYKVQPRYTSTASAAAITMTMQGMATAACKAATTTTTHEAATTTGHKEQHRSDGGLRLPPSAPALRMDGTNKAVLLDFTMLAEAVVVVISTWRVPGSSTRDDDGSEGRRW